MIALSERLKMVCGLVSDGLIAADVACDHAHTAIYLVQSGKCPRVIASDINYGPLTRAQDNIAAYECDEQIETRLSDGLSAYQPGEVQSIIIGGIGGQLTVQILKVGTACVMQAQELILQPQSEVFLVRNAVHMLGFTIVQERMVEEEEKFYVAIKAIKLNEAIPFTKETVPKPDAVCTDSEEKLYSMYGELLLREQNPVLKRYLQKQLQTVEALLERLSDETGERTQERVNNLIWEKKLLKQALLYYHK